MIHINTITADKLFQHIKKGLPENEIVLDIRTRAEYREEHIVQAKNIPLQDIKKHIEKLKQYKKIYILCNTGSRVASAIKILKQHGLDSIIELEGCMMSWKQHELPTIKGKKTMSVMRQVQLTAGSLVFIGAILGYFIAPQWIALSGFVGAGLMFAGLSGTCSMACLLERMPWNK